MDLSSEASLAPEGGDQPEELTKRIAEMNLRLAGRTGAEEEDEITRKAREMIRQHKARMMVDESLQQSGSNGGESG